MRQSQNLILKAYLQSHPDAMTNSLSSPTARTSPYQHGLTSTPSLLEKIEHKIHQFWWHHNQIHIPNYVANSPRMKAISTYELAVDRCVSAMTLALKYPPYHPTKSHRNFSLSMLLPVDTGNWSLSVKKIFAQHHRLTSSWTKEQSSSELTLDETSHPTKRPKAQVQKSLPEALALPPNTKPITIYSFFSRRSVLAAGAGGLVLCSAFGVAAFTEPSSNEYRVKRLFLPQLVSQFEALQKTNQLFVTHTTLKPSDTTTAILKRLNLHNDDQARAFLQSNALVKKYLNRLREDTPIQATVNNNGTLKDLSVPVSLKETGSEVLLIKRRPHGLSAQLVQEATEINYEMRSGKIRESFFDDMENAGVSDQMTEQMVEIFSGVIDFHKDIQTGDAFRLVYESKLFEGQKIGEGRVVAVEFTNRARKYQAILFDRQGQKNYFTFDGVSLKRPFLKAPIEFSRMSSGFGLRRHPVFNQWRMHQGVDYAAPTGTKVFSAGDGVVAFKGRSNGYGNLVTIRHGNGQSTRYGHLSRFAGDLKVGQKVQQGQVIAYVGATGWATGPHLHYEFHLGDRPVDPVKTIPDTPRALTGQERQLFMSHTAALRAKIAALRIFNVAELSQ